MSSPASKKVMDQKNLPLPMFTFINLLRVFAKRAKAGFLLAVAVTLASYSHAQCDNIGFGSGATAADDTKTICAGDLTGITLGSSTATPGASPKYYWEVSIDGGLFGGASGTINNATYNVSTAYKNASGVYKFRRYVSNSTTAGCNGTSDEITLTVRKNTANAGNPLNPVCSGGATSTELLGGSMGSGATAAATSGIWSAPSGSFTDNAGTTPDLAKWNPGATPAGTTVTLTLTATGGTCAAATATKTVKVISGSNYLRFFTQPLAGSFSEKQGTRTLISVAAYDCATGTDLLYTGPITLSIYTGCGFKSKTVNAVAGTASFAGADSVVFTRSPQNNVQLRAEAPGYDAVLSNIFNVVGPGGTPVSETLWANNFEPPMPKPNTWATEIGVPTYRPGAGGGVDWTLVKTFGGNHVMVKSFTEENLEPMLLSTNTITFPVKNTSSTGFPLTDYKNLFLRFKVGSLYDINGLPRTPAYSIDPLTGDYKNPSGGDPTGAGIDPGENMYIEVNIDGTWYRTLNYVIGTKNYTFGLSAGEQQLPYNANAEFTQPQFQSAFRVRIPSGTTSVGLRMVASNNRPCENWGIDDVTLIGDKDAPNLPALLPTAAGTSMLVCPSSQKTIFVVADNVESPATYTWSPADKITSGNANSSAPGVSLAAGTSTPYLLTCTITDADGCTDTGRVSLSFPGGSIGSWRGYQSRDWFNCLNWGSGVLPDINTAVDVSTGITNAPDIDPTSPEALVLPDQIARAKNITLYNTLWLRENATLNIAEFLQIGFNGGFEYGTVDQTANATHTGANTINIGGDWYNQVVSAPTRKGFIPGGGKVTFNHATNLQSINTVNTSENFYNLEVNKNSNILSLNSNVEVAGSLIMTKGVINSKINTPDVTNSLGLLTLDVAANTTGSPDNSTYVNGQMAKRTNGDLANVSYLLPIGKTSFAAGRYQPVWIHPTSPTSGTAPITTYNAEFFSGNPAIQYNNSFVDPVVLLTDKYWIVNRVGAGTARVALSYTTTPATGGWTQVGGGSFSGPIPAGTRVAVAHNNGINWSFTKSTGYNTSGPLYEAIPYTSNGIVYSAPMSSFSPFTIGFPSNIILPVKLLSFEGRLLGTNGSLSWKVADAKDLAGFVLEYSTNGLQYKKLADVAPDGGLDYGYMHRLLPPGTHYYRLLVKEKDGNTYYSGIVTLTVGQLQTQIIGLSSTIAKNKVGVNILSAKSQTAEARITDVLGRWLSTHKTSLQKGINQWQVPTQVLANGMYFVSVITDDGVKATLQFVKE